MTQNTLDKYEQLKQVIQQANPEIIELKFGCYYRWGKAGSIELYESQYKAEYHACRCRIHSFSGQAFSNYKCKYCKQGFSHPNTGTPMYCRPCAEKNEKCQFCGAPMRILGRPIRLADVLLAIDRNPLRTKENSYFVDSQGHFHEWFSPKGRLDLRTVVQWNLHDDNLDHQSDETKQFLIDLLVN